MLNKRNKEHHHVTTPIATKNTLPTNMIYVSSDRFVLNSKCTDIDTIASTTGTVDHDPTQVQQNKYYATQFIDKNNYYYNNENIYNHNIIIINNNNNNYNDFQSTRYFGIINIYYNIIIYIILFSFLLSLLTLNFVTVFSYIFRSPRYLGAYLTFGEKNENGASLCSIVFLLLK